VSQKSRPAGLKWLGISGMAWSAGAKRRLVPPPENLVVQDVPPVPMELAETTWEFLSVTLFERR
jgi:hypothetical protein